MKQVFIFIFFGFFILKAQAQDTCIYLFTIPQKADWATADHLGNVYLLRGFELEKYDSTGRFVSRFSTNRLGVPTYLDVYNPMKIMVWYGEFQTAVFLDRNLTELGRANMAQAGLPALRCLTMAADGNLWAYDDLSTQLLKLNAAGQKLLESQPLSLEFGRRLSPTCIRDNSGQGPWMSDPVLGILVFDPYLINTGKIPAFDLTSFVIQDEMACFIKPDGVYMEPVLGFSNRKMPLPAGLNAAFWLASDKLLTLTETGIQVYAWQRKTGK